MKLKKLISKKILSLISVTIMASSLLAGCGLSNLDDNKKTTEIEAPTTTEEPTTTEPPFEPTEVSIMMIGDMLMHMGVQNSGVMADGSLNYDHLFTHIRNDVQASDIAIVNQEVMIGGKELGMSGYPCFNCAYEVGDALVNAGFNVVLHATNHTMDVGYTGISNCMNFWKNNHPEVAVLGINESQAAKDNNVYVYEKGDIKVAILNYTYGTNGIMLPADMPYLVNLLDEETVKSDLKKAKEMADFVVVCPHWGTEYTLVETDEQHYWAQLFADNGADLIIGAHPHVIEPVAWITAADGRKTLCYYSLGNFVSTQLNASNMLGAMAKVTITNDENGNVSIKDYAVEPLVTQKLFGTAQITTYKLSDYSSELAMQNGILQNDASFSMSYLANTCKQVFGDLYKPVGEAVNYLTE